MHIKEKKLIVPICNRCGAEKKVDSGLCPKCGKFPKQPSEIRAIKIYLKGDRQ